MATSDHALAHARRVVSLGEVVVGLAMVGVALLAWVSLALAHGRVYALVPALVLTAAAIAGLGVAAWKARASRPGIRVAPVQFLVLIGVGGIAAVMSTPGFPVAMAGWDPGVYTNHGLSIARTGAYDLDDPTHLGDAERDLPEAAGGRFPGVSAGGVEPGRATFGFYHLYPALLAPAADVAGERGVVAVNPALGVLAALSLTLVVWRAFGRLGPAAGLLAGVLLSLNMIQVWHARYPTSEMLTLLLVLGATLGVVIAAQTRWPVAAGLGGVLTGLVFLARGDGYAYLVIAVAVLGALAATGRFDRRAWWFAGGLALTLPHGVAQGYYFAANYTATHALPSLAVLGVGLGGLAIIGAALAAVRWRFRSLARRSEAVIGWARRHQSGLGTAFAAAFALVLVGGYLRPLLGPDTVPANANLGGSVPFYSARSLIRLTWFFTPVGIAALAVGVAVVARNRWRFARWAVVLPAIAILPVYLADPRIAARLMWWTRRFVPFTLAGMVALVAVALAAGLLAQGRWRWPLRVTALAATVYLGASWAAMSWPLRDHHELAGSFAVHHAVVAVADDEPAVFLWANEPGAVETTLAAPAFASTIAARTDHVSGRLPSGAGATSVARWASTFPDREVYLVTNGPTPPIALADLGLVRQTSIDVALPLWELTYETRPDRAVSMNFDLTIWLVTHTEGVL